MTKLPLCLTVSPSALNPQLLTWPDGGEDSFAPIGEDLDKDEDCLRGWKTLTSLRLVASLF
ncbi:hypothetical protein [Bradyrhizobium niftali]|jgi:hypothetical protein|uniref:Uncharacterized protein n=1 Tax=Bradyrhizobium niftali TaxID=2560055 RepID=A0A4Y9LDC3_9BRAD|nr:hypothetical protein [Bradyrhizobium niftali]TFV41345.1 hypothetical protein E4K65_36220 [Bradyrhizobium niftali]